jgi:disulfide bond formation protein DsbB
MSVPTASEHELSHTSSSETIVPVTLVLAPFLVALIALVGSLWLSIGMSLKACPLCFYQRTFIMAVVAVLGIGLLTGERHRGVLNLLALPLVVAGLGVAAFHEYLELVSKLECPAGVLGIGTAPQQSLAALAVLLVVVVAGILLSRKGGESLWPVAAASVVVGLLLAWGSVASAPPMPPTPTKAYDPEKQPLDMCRPPFRPK